MSVDEIRIIERDVPSFICELIDRERPDNIRILEVSGEGSGSDKFYSVDFGDDLVGNIKNAFVLGCDSGYFVRSSFDTSMLQSILDRIYLEGEVSPDISLVRRGKKSKSYGIYL